MAKIVYGREYADTANELTIEFDQFKNRYETGEGRFYHLKKIVKILWPSFEWHDWSELLLREFCSGEQHITVSGCSGSGKSTCAAIYALVWWMCDPDHRLVCVTSTTITMSARRIWGQITEFYTSRQGFPGKLMDSEFCIVAKKGDRKHSISVIPGSREKTVEGLGKIKGWHADGVLVIGDELQDMTDEIIKGLTNIMTGATEKQFIGLGNPTSQLDTHGKECKPKEGWESINDGIDRWLTAKGVCIRLDGMKSPNLPVKSFRGIISQEDIDKTVSDFGRDSLQYWTMCRGMWPPADAAIDRVVSFAILSKNKCFERVAWYQEYSHLGGLDPAYGGDRCVLRFGKSGQTVDHRQALELESPIIVPIRLSEVNNPVEHQIGQYCIDRCKEKNMMPRDFSLDSTAQGKAVYNYMLTHWGPVNAVEFGGMASDMVINAGASKTGKEEYGNRVTELWYSIRRFAENGQLKNLDDETAEELMARKITLTGKPARILVEPKKDVKKTLGRSPDLADCLAVLVHSARLRGVLSGENRPKGQQDWRKVVKRVNSIYNEEFAYRD